MGVVANIQATSNNIPVAATGPADLVPLESGKVAELVDDHREQPVGAGSET